MGQRNIKGSLSLRGFRKLRTGAIVATGVILLGLGFFAPTVSANEQDGVWVARTVAEVKADIQNMNGLSYYTIQWGDTLSVISGATGLSVDSLVEINRIADRDLIFANNKLYFSEEAFRQEGNTKVRTQRVTVDNSSSCQSYEVETKTDTVTGDQTTTVRETTPAVVEEPVSPAPKSKAPVVSIPKSGGSVELPPSTAASSIGHSEESEKPSTAPAVGSTTEQPSDTSSVPVTPSEETLESTANTSSSSQPAGGTAPATSNNPSTSATNEVSNAGESTPDSEAVKSGTDNASSSAETTDQSVTPTPNPEVPAPKAEAPAPSNKPSTEENGGTSTPVNPKDESSTPTPETSTSEPKSEEELKKEEALKSAKKESIDDNIGEVVKIKADAIEKVTDADEKARLKEALKALQDKAIEEINKAKDEEEVASITDKHQNIINALVVPGEEVSSPNYGKEGLTNKGPGGTTIDNGSTAIGHGASGTSRRSVSSPENRSA